MRADLVRTEDGKDRRKILHECTGCAYLYCKEKKVERSAYFSTTPHDNDLTGHRGQREVDLVNCLASMQGFGKELNVLVYAVGTNRSPELLRNQGYTNVWSCDVSDDIEYSDRQINIGKDPTYFAEREINFDLIVAVEVWEHYERANVLKSFEWLFRQLREQGQVVGATSVWNSDGGNSYFRGRFESGDALLSWWHYPFFLDHTSFYTEKNLTAIGEKFGYKARFAYFANPYVHLSDPTKRIVLFHPKDSGPETAKLSGSFDRKFLEIFY
jgi:hypothetical protein